MVNTNWRIWMRRIRTANCSTRRRHRRRQRVQHTTVSAELLAVDCYYRKLRLTVLRNARMVGRVNRMQPVSGDIREPSVADAGRTWRLWKNRTVIGLPRQSEPAPWLHSSNTWTLCSTWKQNMHDESLMETRMHVTTTKLKFLKNISVSVTVNLLDLEEKTSHTVVYD